MAKGQAERLVPMLEEVMTKAGLVWENLDAIGVGTGPGNFTGIRISVAAARGFALALDRPAIGVTNHDALAYEQAGDVTAIVDARRGRVYAQPFRDGVAQTEIIETDRESLSGTLLEGSAVANIARIAAERIDEPAVPPAPVYVRPADAAPATEKPPRIIP